MASQMKSLLVPTAKFALALSLVFWLVSQGHLDFSLLSKLLQPHLLLILTLLTGLNLLLANWRWTLLLQARGFAVRHRDTFPLYLIGLFFNYAIPGAIGGDVVKAFYLTKDHPKRKIEAVTTVAMDRLLGLYAMAMLALMAILLDLNLVLTNLRMQWVALIIFALFLAMSLFFISAFSSWLKSRPVFQIRLARLPAGATFLGLYESVHAYRAHWPVLGKTLLISLAAQFVAVFFMWVVGQALGYREVSPITYLFAVPIGFMLSALPLSPAGVGVGQMAFLFLFSLHLGTSSEVGPAVITVFQIALFAWGLVGAVFYLRRKQGPQKQSDGGGELALGGYSQDHNFAKD